MPDIKVIIARPSTRCVLREFKVNKVINEVFNTDIIELCSSADDSDFGDYILLVTPVTQAIYDSVNECNIQKAMTYHEQGAEMGGLSKKFI
jgi:hypothetical protein